MLRILYLDKDPSNTITRQSLPTLKAEIIPQTAASILRPDEFPVGVIIRDDLAINPTRNSWAFKQPTEEDLMKVLQLTTNKEVSLIIIGNNQGIGALLAAFVADPLLSKTIITSHFPLHPAEVASYQRMGIIHFSTRELLHVKIRELLELPS